MMSPDDVSLGSLLPHQMHVFPCCVNWSIGSVCVCGGGGGRGVMNSKHSKVQEFSSIKPHADINPPSQFIYNLYQQITVLHSEYTQLQKEC